MSILRCSSATRVTQASTAVGISHPQSSRPTGPRTHRRSMTAAQYLSAKQHQHQHHASPSRSDNHHGYDTKASCTDAHKCTPDRHNAAPARTARGAPDAATRPAACPPAGSRADTDTCRRHSCPGCGTGGTAGSSSEARYPRARNATSNPRAGLWRCGELEFGRKVPWKDGRPSRSRPSGWERVRRPTRSWELVLPEA